MCCSDREYPRLGQMIVDYENPLKKMMEEFVPHGKVENLHFILPAFYFGQVKEEVFLLRCSFAC